ncbi:MAG: GAF domain-containing protein [Alphaproteobacteria bacterium]|nr:GAF domain-containing protein [Alphaproteobacteria bacterium]
MGDITNGLPTLSAAQLEALSRFLLECAGARSEEDCLDAIARSLGPLCGGLPRASVTLPTGDGQHLAVVSLQGAKAVPLGATLPIAQTWTGKAYATGQPRVIEVIPEDTTLLDLGPLRAFGIRSCLAIPLCVEGQVMGVLNLARATPHDWREELPLLLKVAAVAATQLKLREDSEDASAQMAQSRRLSEAFSLVAEAGRELAMADAEAQVMEITRRWLPRLLPETHACLVLVEEGKAGSIVHVLVGSGPATATPRQTLSARYAPKIMHDGKPLLIQDVSTETEWAVEQLQDLGLRSALCVPLYAGPRCLGTLNFARAEPSAFNEQDVRVGQHLAATVGAALVAAKGCESLRRAREEAEEAARQKDQFLAVMAHELRTPLHAVLGTLQLLKARKGVAPSGHELEMLLSSGELLASLVDDLLDFSRLQRGEVRLRAQRFDVGDLLRATASMLREQAWRGGIRVETEAPSFTLCSDPDRVRQVLVNLLENALKYTPRGGRVRVAAWPEGEGARFEVCDTGVGISEESLGEIFEPFRQIGGFRADREHGGVGLGLAICKGLCRAMGGDIAVRSVLGQGSTFSFHVLDLHSTPAAQARPEPRHSALPMLRVLVVDDNEINRVVAQAMLERLGQVAEVAHSGAEAMERYGAQRFDLVLMDLHMPGEDGHEVARRLLAMGGPQAVVVALTADTRPDVQQRCLAAGIPHVLTKPLRLTSLEDFLRRVQPRRGQRSAMLLS